jgi:DNA-binding CsgD family transcriptional regulator
MGIAFLSFFPKQTRITYLYRLLMILMTFDLLLAPQASLGFTQVQSAYVVNIVASAGFCMIILTVAGNLCRGNRRTSIRTAALLYIAWDIGPLCGLLIGKQMASSVDLTLSLLYPLTTLIVVIWLIVYAFVFNEQTLQSVLSVISTKGSGNFMKHCRIVSEHFGLSERESEVLIYFAKGRNSAYIQNELCLSKNTVNSHRKHIYTKLGIHSNQDLINMVQGSSSVPSPFPDERTSG